MIEREILEIIKSEPDDGTRLNQIADEFRRGRDVADLMILISSKNDELISIGAWILSEVKFELYNSGVFITRLRELTEHDKPSVRFHALEALFPALDPRDLSTRALLQRLLNDENAGVRGCAKAAVARLGLK